MTPASLDKVIKLQIIIINLNKIIPYCNLTQVPNNIYLERIVELKNAKN